MAAGQNGHERAATRGSPPQSNPKHERTPAKSEDSCRPRPHFFGWENPIQRAETTLKRERSLCCTYADGSSATPGLTAENRAQYAATVLAPFLAAAGRRTSAAQKTWSASACSGQSPIAYTDRSGGPVLAASWQAIQDRHVRDERHRHMRQTLVQRTQLPTNRWGCSSQ